MHTFLSKIDLKKYSKKHLGILFVVGVLLIIISMPTSKSTEEDKEEVTEVEESLEEVIISDYKTQMEEQLALLLSQVEGVGEVKVMITLSSTSEKIVEKDLNTDTDTVEETTIYQEGENGQEPYITTEVYPTIEGVVVLAEGGGNSIIVQNITEAVQALFDVDTHKIKIMKMK